MTMLNSKKPKFFQSLRTKTMLALSAGVAVLVATLYATGHVYLLRSFESLEQREGLATMERVRQTVKEQESFLLTKNQDWAFWDDAYKFVQDGNKAFKESNLTDNALGNLKIHILVYLNAKNEVMSFLQGKKEDFTPAPRTEGAELFLGADSPFLKWGEKLEDGRSGIVLLPEGPALIVSRPVITSELKGPIAGTLIFGQYLDERLLTRLSELTNLKLSLDILADSAKTEGIYKTLDSKNPIALKIQSDSLLQGYTSFQDAFGKPGIGLTSPIPRELMSEGRKTIALFTRIVAGLGFLFIILMGLVIDRAMVARLLGLSDEVSNIAPGALADSNESSQVSVNGSDEVAVLAAEINTMLETIAKHSRAMADIVDNVSFGFLICDLSGKIRPGFTKSCATLLDRSPDQIPALSITEAFRMNAKEADWFMTLYGQLCEDIFPEETSLSQMPSRFVIESAAGRRTVRLEGRLLRESNTSPRAVLFSITDITDLERAEVENREAKTLLKIMQSPKAFTDFISEAKTQLQLLGSAILSHDNKVCRRILHTLKGNAACFGLEGIAHKIHVIEDQAEILLQDVAAIQTAIKDFLDANRSVLGIEFDAPNAISYTIKPQDLEKLESIVLSTRLTAEERANQTRTLLRDFRRKNAAELLGPISDMATQTANRLGKEVEFKVLGADVRVDPDYFKAVSEILPHMIRNSLDHGIEFAEDRIDLDKPSRGSIRLEIKDAPAKNGVQVILSDDGRGIATEKVAKRALAMGVLGEASLKSMSENEIAELIFVDALSTAAEVSEVSGRGFGMSAVKENIVKAGGEIKIDNRPMKGCTISIFIPYGTKASQERRAA